MGLCGNLALKTPTSAYTYFVGKRIKLDINCSLRITNYKKSDSLGSHRQNTYKYACALTIITVLLSRKKKNYNRIDASVLFSSRICSIDHYINCSGKYYKTVMISYMESKSNY